MKKYASKFIFGGMKSKIPIPPTINIHSLVPCNYSCEYCYAGFTGERPVLPQAEVHSIIQLLAQVPLPDGCHTRKVTFAGGEPLLNSRLLEDLAVAKSEGLITSLVTNGSLLNEEIFNNLVGLLDWLTISVDSLRPDTNLRIGRCVRGKAQTADVYRRKLAWAKERGIRTKVNTVVSALNLEEDFSEFVNEASPLRWKLFQVTRINGENDGYFSRWAISDEQFRGFVDHHRRLVKKTVCVVPEAQSDMYGSYAMVAPNGCFFDNSGGFYRYSRPIIDVGVVEAFSDIRFSWESFRRRGGDYDPSCNTNEKGSK